MSLLETEDYFEIPEVPDHTSGQVRPLWSSAGAHLDPPNQEQVEFLVTNSGFTQAYPRRRITSKVLKAMERDQDAGEATRACYEQGAKSDSYSRQNEAGISPDHEVLDAWNPMSDDYDSKAFNSYKEPSIADFMKSFPGSSGQTAQLSTNSALKSNEDVRLFVGRIPQQITQEGLSNLFSQVGKLVYCKLISQQSKDTNIGFLGYQTVREAEAAIQKFDGFDLGQGVRLKVALALAKQKPVITDLEEKEPTCVENGTTSNSTIESAAEGTPVRQNQPSIQDDVSPFTNISKLSTGKPCNFCGKLGLKWCSVCKIPYCSRDCQKSDWPKHKLVCPRQPPTEKQTTYSATSVPLTTTTTPGDSMQPTDLPQEHTDSQYKPPEDSLQHSEEGVTTSAYKGSDEEAEPSPDNEKEPVRVDGFDVNNVEMFAEMMGFDLNQVKFVEKSRDGDDDSDKSSSSSLDKSIPQHVLPNTSVPVPSIDVSSQQTSHTENQARRQSRENVVIEPVSPLTVPVSEQENSTPQQPTCARAHKRFFVNQLPIESVPASGFFEAVVTEVENPSCMWVQLLTPEALERREQLKEKLQASYSNSKYENYVPSGGEVCVAQFSFDCRWYRVKVDIVNNTGTLRVTYIDFGNHEDVTVDKVRRITEDFASFPRQALKLSLYNVTSTSPSGRWSSEATAVIKSKVLGQTCKVQVGGQHNDVFFVKLFDPNEANSDTTVNESLIKAGFAKPRGRPASSQNTAQQYSDNTEKRLFNRSNSSQGGGSAYEQQRGYVNQVKSPCQSPRNAPPVKECGNSVRNFTGASVQKEPFEAVVNAIVSPWEFHVQKTDPQLLGRLNELMRDLNQCLNVVSCTPHSKTFSQGEVCAAKFSLDNLWYRAVVLEKLLSDYRVRYMDFGNSEVVHSGSVAPLPQQFQSFPPLSLQCSLAGVTKPKGQDWSPQAVQHFKSLVTNKQFVFKIIYIHGVTNLVELLDPRQNKEQSVASSLISAGLAVTFIPKAGAKHQSDGKIGPSFTGPQQLGNGRTPEPKGLGSDTRRSAFSPQSSPNNTSSPVPRDRIEDAVFEPAIQAAALPPDTPLDVLVLEVISPGLLYCGSVESSLNSAKLTQDMNEHYNAVSYPPFVARENDLCAALFTKSGDWCRAFIKGTSPDGTVYVHYVDYGNTEFVPQDRLRPLLEQFNFSALPFCALRCSLANVLPVDSSGWSDKSMGFVKTLLPEFSRCNARLVGRGKGKFFLDITANETGESVSQSLVNQGMARAMAKAMNDRSQTGNLARVSRNDTYHSASPQRERPDFSRLESLVYQPAIQSATLPQDKSSFGVMLTAMTKSGLFFIQVADLGTAQNLKKLLDNMNAYYSSSEPTSFRPQPNQLCAALFAETGDWCRALIKEVTPDGLVDVHYVDFGNTEKLPVSSIKPLEDKFANVPFFALPCSLANIAPPEPPGWSDQAMTLIRENVPLNQPVSARVMGKRRGMLFIDFVIPKDPPQSLSQLMLDEGLAQRSLRRPRAQEPLNTPSQQSASSTSSSRQAGDLESCVFAPAIQSVVDLESFDAMLTAVSSPSSFFIQVLRRDQVEILQQLSADLNHYYSTVNYPSFQAQTNQMCAGLFSGSGDWCRSFIDRVNPDGSVHVHYVDYGNSEVLPTSKVRPLDERFQHLAPMALKCSLSGVLPAHSNGWSDNAKEAMLSQAPLESRLHVSVTRRESSLLFIDAVSPGSPSQESLNQFLIKQGLATANPPGDQPVQSASSAPASDSRVYASAVPLVDVPQGTTCRVLVSEVQRPDKIFFQVLNNENVNGLLTLSDTLNTHCSTTDSSPYRPVLGELCCAKFSEDQCWYRAVVVQEITESQMMVAFVDYGNQAEVAVNSIRRITPSFTRLPFQARECFLAGMQPVSGSSWSNDAVKFLKERLTPQKPEPFFAKFDSTEKGDGCFGVQLFEVDPSGEPGNSVSQDMIQRGLARSQSDDGCTALQMIVPVVDQFDVVVTLVVHPGEIWAQALDAEAHNSLDLLMKDINQYCVQAAVPTSPPQPGQECCAQFSQDGLWYRARVLECLPSDQVAVQYVDFGNSECLTPSKLRSMKDEFFKLPSQALKLSLANIRPAHQVWSQEAVEWLEVIINRQLKATVVHRLSEHLVVLLEDWNVPNGPVNISEELISRGHAVKS